MLIFIIIDPSGLLQNPYCVLSFQDFVILGVFVSPPYVVLHGLTNGSMVGMITVIEDELFGRCEVAFDAVHPRCICCRVYQFEIVLLTPVHNFGLAVRSHIVQDNV